MNKNEMIEYEVAEKERKISELLFLADEIRMKMIDSGRLSANKEFDYSNMANVYALLIKEKESKELDEKKLKIMEKTFENILSELEYQESIRSGSCLFEEFIRTNIKYVNIEEIIQENQLLNPFTYDMKKEFFFHCLGELNAIKIEDVREENILDYEKTIYFISSLQSTLISLLSLKLEAEYDERISVVEAELKLSPEECIYLEKYMALIKRDMGFLIVNAMKQNLMILSDKINCNNEFLIDKSLNELEQEYQLLYEKVVNEINSFKGTSFLPKEYSKKLIPQLENIDNFILVENSSFVRLLK